MATPIEDIDLTNLATRKLLAETFKLEAENRKFEAERRKAELESDALHRWRYFAIPVGMAAIIGAVMGLVVSLLGRH